MTVSPAFTVTENSPRRGSYRITDKRKHSTSIVHSSVNILGISAYYHDSAAALLKDGHIIAAAQEERFTRIKHDASFPHHAIQYCLSEAGLEPEQLDYITFYEKPLLKFERLLETYLSFAPVGYRSFRQALPLWLNKKLHLPREIKKSLDNRYRKRIIFPQHHESHAASAFFPSPFEEAAIVTLDGVGEWTTTSIGQGKGNRIHIEKEIQFPHSLGLLYSAFTYFCGFKVNSGEYKLMGLAPYGKPRYAGKIREHLIDIKEDGSFRLNQDYFNYCQGLTMTGAAFEGLFDGPPRKPETPLTEREMDLAASVQLVTEEVMLKISRHAREITGRNNLCLAGGVALNCVGNGRILRESGFSKVWIQPAAGDAGGALGAAQFVWHQLLGNKRVIQKPDSQQASLLGPSFNEDTIRSFLDGKNATYHHIAADDALYEQVSNLIEQQNVIGWMQGKMEFGPRALGSRSIIGDARSSEMQTNMNLKIKFRESFRPFAPIVLKESVHEYFEMREGEDSPYMLMVAPVREIRRKKLKADNKQGLEKLSDIRSDIPAVTHVDYSARVQTVDKERFPRLHKLMSTFNEKTGCPVLINTSFNVRGEPIVCTPENAYHCFMITEMDVLVIGNFLLLKKEQNEMSFSEREKHLKQFTLD